MWGREWEEGEKEQEEGGVVIHWDSYSNIHLTVHSGSYSISHTHIRTLLCGFGASSATPSSLLLILHKVRRRLHRVRKKTTLNKAQYLKAMIPEHRLYCLY